MTRAGRHPAFYCLAALLAILVPAWAAGWAEEADRLQRSGRWQDALATLDPVARSGDPRAQAMLGNLLLAQKNPARDVQVGMLWLRRAARQGNVNALATVGYPVPYVAEASLSCGNATLTVMTSCRSFGPAEGPFCHSQTYLFRWSQDKRPRRVFTETHADFADSPLLAVGMACSATGFVVDYSNLGGGRECTTCEDRRHFDKNGRRVRGSDPDTSSAAAKTVKIGWFPAPAALEAWFKE